MAAALSDAEPLDAFLDRLIFLSNAVPKSGSTYLFGLQDSFLLGLAGKKKADLSYFQDHGVRLSGGFVWKPHEEAFLSAITSNKVSGGPYVLKLHTMFNARLRDTFLAQDNIFASLAIRDPAHIFFSARDNFAKTGEFPEFADEEKGCELIDGYFSKILQSVRVTAKSKPIPVVRYETIVGDPLRALSHSLGPTLRTRLFPSLIAGQVDIGLAARRSSGRFNLGGLERPEAALDPQGYDRIADRLRRARREFGYE